mgnify:FL=1
MKIVDAHVHLGTWREFDLSFSLEDLEVVMTQYRYSGAVVLPALEGHRFTANQSLLKQVAGDSRFYFFAWVDGTTTQAELESYGSDLRGLKFHPSISQKPITEGRLSTALEFANKRSLPFLYHTGRTPISWPERLMAVVSSYPKVKFVMAHMGGNAYDRINDTLQHWPTLPENVWVESSTARHPDLLKRAIAQ